MTLSMLRNLLTPVAVSLLLLGTSGSAWARGGSVRYSGGGRSTAGTSAARTNTSAGAYRAGGATRTTAAGTPVRYQAPVNRPVGAGVRNLPVGYRRMAVAGRNYYYYDGNYYEESESTEDPYTVVAPPLGASIDTLPASAVQIVPGVYEYNGVKYRPSYEDGKIVYVVSN